MPKLIKTSSKMPHSVGGKFTKDEYERLQAAAKQAGMTTGRFAREMLLSSLGPRSIDQLLLAETCEVKALMQLFFGALVEHIDKVKAFDKSRIADALTLAKAAKYKKAGESLAAHSALREAMNVE